LAGYLAGFQNKLTAAPIEAHTVNIEHFGFLSSVREKREGHGQDGEMLPLRRRRVAREHPAILPWRPSLSSFHSGAVCAPFLRKTGSLCCSSARAIPARLQRRGLRRAATCQRRMPSRSIKVR
jgi:hypothetical protein